MRRQPGQALRLGVGVDSLALLKTGGWFDRSATVLAEVRLDPAGGEAALGQGLRRLLAELPVAGWPVTVVLADDLARLWQVTPPQAAGRMADLEAAAALRFQGLFGAPAAGWQISADWHAARPFLAAALPLPLLATLQQCAAEHRIHLVEIVPQFVAALNGWRKRRRAGAWFGRVEGPVLTLAAFEQGALASVRTAVIPPAAERSWLDAHIAREALLVGTGRPELVQLCGAVPRAWGSNAGRLAFACTVLEDEDGAPDWSNAARLALTGSPA
jgi:hypothetical protein